MDRQQQTTKSSVKVSKCVLAKRRREKFIRRVTCQVCGDVANDHIHYGAISCYSCRAFFRRCRTKTPLGGRCESVCKIDVISRKFCAHCRYLKCLAMGMNPRWVMTEEDKKEKKEKAHHASFKTQYEERMW